MNRSKTLISEALATLADNFDRTGDPLGFKSTYWTAWSKGLNLPKEGETLLFTGRMYQMMPYIIQTTKLISFARPFMVIRGANRLIRFGNRVAGETLIGLKAIQSREIRKRGIKTLKGIVAALKAVGIHPSYLYEEEPYSGVLLHDLGMNGDVVSHMKRVYKLLKNRGVKQIITTDPHSASMLKTIYPQYLKVFDLEIKHYLEVLSDKAALLKDARKESIEKKFVIHDSCVMTRDLGLVEQPRKVAAALGIDLIEPKNARMNTACCGGPIEYAFGELSEKVSSVRSKELSEFSKNAIVNCPICLINLSKYETPSGMRVWDMGELLFEAMNSKA